MDQETEKQLILECISGNREAQKELYYRYSSKMYLVCLRYLKQKQDAEDALQDGFIRVFRLLKDFRNEGSFEGWLRRIFMSVSMELLNRRKKIVGVEYIQITIKPEALNNLYFNELNASLSKLSGINKEAFTMFAVYGYSHKQIADHLKIAESTSRSHTRRARQILNLKRC